MKFPSRLMLVAYLKVDTKKPTIIYLSHWLSDLALVIYKLMAKILQLIGSWNPIIYKVFKRPRWSLRISSINNIFWSPKSTNIITQPLFLSVFGGFISLGGCQKKNSADRRPWHHSSANPGAFLESGVSGWSFWAISRKMSYFSC